MLSDLKCLDEKELRSLGLAACGTGVRISRLASFHGASRASIGSNVRIDDFAVISAGEGGLTIGNHVHLGVYVALIGAAPIRIADFAGLSARVSIYSSSDDFGGDFLTGPTVPASLRRVDSRPVSVGRHAVVGAGSVVLPGADIGDGAVIGAMSLVKGSVPDFNVYAGVPARRIRARSRDLLRLEASLGESAAGS